jgi:uncharacterized protein with HEPN domain
MLEPPRLSDEKWKRQPKPSMNEISRQWLHDALKSAELIEQHADGMTPAEFASDEWFRSAVERRLEIIGEALNRVRKRNPDIEHDFPTIHRWIAQRNIMAHLYDQIDDTLVWQVVCDELPLLIETLNTLLSIEDER